MEEKLEKSLSINFFPIWRPVQESCLRTSVLCPCWPWRSFVVVMEGCCHTEQPQGHLQLPPRVTVQGQHRWSAFLPLPLGFRASVSPLILSSKERGSGSSWGTADLTHSLIAATSSRKPSLATSPSPYAAQQSTALWNPLHPIMILHGDFLFVYVQTLNRPCLVHLCIPGTDQNIYYMFNKCVNGWMFQALY